MIETEENQNLLNDDVVIFSDPCDETPVRVGAIAMLAIGAVACIAVSAIKAMTECE